MSDSAEQCLVSIMGTSTMLNTRLSWHLHAPGQQAGWVDVMGERRNRIIPIRGYLHLQ